MGDFPRIEARSLILHRAVAARLLKDPELWARARQRLEEWRASGLRHPYYLSAWDGLVDAPVENVAEAIQEPGERGQRLRRASPFAGVLSSSERWRVWRAAARFESPARRS